MTKRITINGIQYDAEPIATTQEDHHHGVLQLWNIYDVTQGRSCGRLARWGKIGLGNREAFAFGGQEVEVVGIVQNRFGVWVFSDHPSLA